MLTYSFTDIGAEPLYQHLYQCIKNDVISGILSPTFIVLEDLVVANLQCGNEK